MALPETDHPLMTSTEVASVFRVDPKTVARWANEGRIQGIRTLGGYYRFRRAEVERVLAEGAEECHSAVPAVAPSPSRQLCPRPEPDPPGPPDDDAPDGGNGPDDELPDVIPRPDADVVWAYFDTDTGDAVLTLTDDARGVLRLRTDHEEHEAVLLALLTAACVSARTAQDQDTVAWWAAVARRGEAVLDQIRGVGRLPQVSREDP